MSARYRVAATTRIVEAPSYVEPRDAISHDWVAALDRMSCLPLLVPNVVGDPVAFVEALAPDVLLLTNGEDIQPSLYGGEPNGERVCSPARDETESALLTWAIERRLPVLACCRGFQLLNVHYGGSLVADIGRDPDALDHVAVSHRIDILDPATSTALGRESACVNSYHRQGVSNGTIAPGLIPFAATSDGIVEGVLVPDLPILGIQWHPERGLTEDPFQSAVAERFISRGPWW